MKLYAIRHKASGLLMPNMKRNKGFTSWNPNKGFKLKIELDTPRLINGYKKARRIAKIWASEPNLTWQEYNTYDGSDYRLDIKRDGRKIEDIELVQVILSFQKSRVEL